MLILTAHPCAIFCAHPCANVGFRVQSQGGAVCGSASVPKISVLVCRPPALAHENPPFFCPAIAKKKREKHPLFFRGGAKR